MLKIIFLLLIITTPIYAESLSTIVTKAEEFDGKEVEVEGEVLEKLIFAKENWINIFTAEEKIGLFFDKQIVMPEIKYRTGYNQKGDKIKVKGIFRKNFAKADGEMCIEVISAEKVEEGFKIKEKVNPAKRDTAKILIVINLIMFLLFLIKRFINERKTKRNFE